MHGYAERKAHQRAAVESRERGGSSRARIVGPWVIERRFGRGCLAPAEKPIKALARISRKPDDRHRPSLALREHLGKLREGRRGLRLMETGKRIASGAWPPG